MTEDQRNPVWQEGFAARMSVNYLRVQNPYDPFNQPDKYRLWLRGYQAAHKELDG